MANVPTFTKSGSKAATAAKLDSSVFGVLPENHDLLKLAYVAHLANGRENLAVVKTRGLVSGGGKKPWKQKGTGRARFGSSRNPIWRGGGIVFGPTGEENYTKKLQVGAKRKAIRQALSLAAEESRIKVVEELHFTGKVKDVNDFLQKIEATGRVLLVVDAKDEKTELATRNLQNVTVVHAQYLNVRSILDSDTIVISKPALELVHEWLGGKK
ncbi:MAG TPA: 50S ribosomal protein L4 [Candidatus Saccharimonadales bacterium]|nr:50S ribosomal protein L4 [Candidatus Saccharimonadales bacterium]